MVQLWICPFSGPVTPDAVESFVREGVEVLVQPCDRRVWKDEEFIKVFSILGYVSAYPTETFL